MKNKKISTLISFGLFLALTISPLQNLNYFSSNPAVVHAATTSSLPASTKDGAILHAFDWSFNTIKSELPSIAASGYKSIQVSPVQGTKDSSTDPTKWWLLYQPTNQAVGNAQLGSLSDFTSLCITAKSYGISIIVDVVMNHMANNGNKDQLDPSVDSSFQNSSLYHNLGQCSNWSNRYDVTQKGIGMPDLNTQTTEVQNKAITFLNQCVDAGASGFRFDAAKHIETNIGLDAGQSWSGNYWTNVLGNLHNKSNIFVYGEILQDGTVDNIANYETFMNVTASSYGGSVRSAITSNDLSKAGGMGGLNSTKSVDFVETHDTYEDGSTRGLTDLQRKIGWAIVDSRAGTTPLFFDRPTSSIGLKGESLWKDADVVALNQFHNAMIGQTEYLRWTNNNQTMLIDRGTTGTVLVNSGSNTSVNSPTNLANGTYTNKAAASCTLTVSNGTISGSIPANSVIILYNAGTPTTTLTASANIIGGNYTSAQSVILTPSKTADIYYTTDGSTPNSSSTKYTGAINVSSSLTIKYIAIDSLGVSSPVYTEAYVISASTAYTPNSGYKVDYDSSKLLQGKSFTVYYNGSLANSSSVSMHWGYNGWVGASNATMTKRSDGFWAATITIPTTATKLDFDFTDGSSYDNNSSNDWHLQVWSGSVPVQVSPAPVATKSVTVYYNGTLAASATSMTLHWGYNNFTSPKDATMTKQANGTWAATITMPSGSYMLNMAFNNNASTWDSNNSVNYNYSSAQ
ncbi:chitobiase/beta-hexosaminidase C-terminal domain-containing protein [Clostridium frigoris]|uniref:Alpha-amylase n=1 Tax=Clostridium frigoris TaxID=205327 RepID=A0ABS6BQE7_9CLOT|nr:carbohydrate-binding protein [Clostridium frigoris]MBU3158244.1 chitobiase/beta-hexosaminidase C-terminal domain-containing protein [Clostridium frigoris]